VNPLPDAYDAYRGDIREVLFSADQLQQRVTEMGQTISQEYAGRVPLLVGVLKGVVPFMADLMRAITIPVEMDFMAISSYSPETRNRGAVRIEKDLTISVTDRHVIFIEDVVDTGLTLTYLLNNLRARGTASLEVCVLFDRVQRRLIDIPMRYKGFELPDRFVVGYGLDYKERYRNLPFVGLLQPHVLQNGGNGGNGSNGATEIVDKKMRP
jgi:hypoxanthine phosphoribosyltransferase